MANPADDEALHEAYMLAAETMASGGSVPEIRILLMGKGLSHEEATRIISEVEEARFEVANEDANQMMKSGMFWGVGGLLVTLVTYGAAANGGTYIIAWGAMLYGAAQYLQGRSLLNK